MSGATIKATITVKATPDTVLTAFQAIERWSAWYPGVIDASWVTGAPWVPTAVMQIQVKNSLGMRVSSQAVVLPPVADQENGCKLVWENRSAGLVTVCHAWVVAVESGSRLTLQKFYGGRSVPLLRLMKGRQQRMLEIGLARLQTLV